MNLPSQEWAGFSLEEIIRRLVAGVGVDALCQLLELHLGEVDPRAARSSRWIM